MHQSLTSAFLMRLMMNEMVTRYEISPLDKFCLHMYVPKVIPVSPPLLGCLTSISFLKH